LRGSCFPGSFNFSPSKAYIRLVEAAISKAKYKVQYLLIMTIK
jgi:hypothetical protein